MNKNQHVSLNNSHLILSLNPLSFRTQPAKLQYYVHVPTKHETNFFLPKHSTLHDLKTLLRPATLKDSSYPVPIFSIRFDKKYLKFDPIASIVEEKEEFINEKRILGISVHKQIPKFPDNAVTSEFMDYIAMKFNDPDQTSTRVIHTFNWRHHGGNLSHQRLNNDLYLVQSSLSDSDELPLRLVKTGEFNHVARTWNEDYLRNNYVYEIVKLGSLYALRKKKTAQIVSVTDSNEPVTFTSKEDISSCLLTSDDLYTIDIKGQLTRLNITTELTVRCEKLSTNGYPITLKHFNNDIFTVSDAVRVFQYDIRFNEETVEFFSKSNFAIKCEEIFAHEKSLVNEHLIFVATSHLLYLCDTRKPSRSVVMQANHQLFRPPMMIKLGMLDNKVEIICLASNHPNDIKIFSFSHNHGAVDLLPLTPMSLEKPLNEIRMKGKLILTENLTKRIRMNISGIDMITNRRKGTIKLFVQTSIGDIFKTEIYTKEVPEKCNFEDEYLQWSDAVSLHHPAPEKLVYTDIVNLKGLRRVFLHLKTRQQKEQQVGGSSQEVETNDFHKMHEKKIPEWKVSMKEAKNYHDVLAPLILAPWEVDADDEDDNLFNSSRATEHNKPMRVDEKVFNWLTSYGGEETIVKQEEISEELTAIDDEQNVNFDFSFDDAQQCSAAVANKTMSFNATQQTTAKKRKRRVKGF